MIALWKMMERFITIRMKRMSESQFQMQARLPYKIKLLKMVDADKKVWQQKSDLLDK